MLQEPLVYCKQCSTKWTLREGAQIGMVCPSCNIRLEMMDNNWFAGAMNTDANGSGTVKKGDYSTGFSENTDPVRVAELWLPAHNEMDEPAVSQFIASLPTPIGLEYLGVGSRRTMMVRAPYSQLKHTAGMVMSTWPSAYLQILDQDPLETATNRSELTKYSVTMQLDGPGYLPLRTWLTYLKGDPVHNLLSATLGLNADEYVWMQFLALDKGTPVWLSDVQRRLKLESQRGFVVNADSEVNSMVNSMPVQSINYRAGLSFIGYVALAFIAAMIGLTKGWLAFGLAAIICGALGYGLYKLTHREPDEWYNADLQLIKQKAVQQDSFFKTTVRATVWAATPERGRELMQRLMSALSQYTVSGGNRLIIAQTPMQDNSLWPVKSLSFSPEGKWWGWFSPVELGGFWHPPINNERVSPGLIPVRGIEVRAPDPADVQGYYEIGKYFRPDGEMEPVKVTKDTMKRNIFLIGKPGVGKTNLMEHLTLAGLEDPDQPAIVVIDPHGDMADRLLGTIPPQHADRVVVMDIGDQDYVLTYNPLDVHSHGWTVDQTSELIVDIGRSLWSDFWGPRMQVPLKRGVQIIAAANALRQPGKALGMSLLSGLLNTSPDVRKRFIENELDGSEYKDGASRYFNGDFKNLSQSMREQIIQPVLSKAYRFEESPMLELFSSPSSKLIPSKIINERKILVVNTRMSRFGSEMSDFIGSLIVNAIMREITRQGEGKADKRAPVLLVIDEFQTFTGVPWQELVAQLRKYGGRTILGTQSLASLKVDDPELVGVIMSGVYSVFGFMMSGEDARYMSENELSERDGGPTASTLAGLEPFRAYARTVRADGRLTRPYYFVVAPPAQVNENQLQRVLEARRVYSTPREVARKETFASMAYLDQYGALLMSGGVGGGAMPKQPRVPIQPMPEVAKSVMSDGKIEREAIGSQKPLWVQVGNIGDPENADAAFDESFGLQEDLGVDINDTGDDGEGHLIAGALRDAPIIPDSVIDEDESVSEEAAKLESLFEDLAGDE